MKKRTYLPSPFLTALVANAFFLLLQGKALSQPPTYYGLVQPIILESCAPCHRPGGGGPFSLLTYEDARNRSSFIAYVVKERFMPPWFADPSYRSFHNQVVLTDDEVEIIRQWAETGASAGERKTDQLVIQKNFEKKYPKQDVSVFMQKPFNIPGNNTEQFRIFIMPTHTEKEHYAKGIRFEPGNLELSHHARLMLDTTHLLRSDDGCIAGDSNTAFTRLGVKLASQFWHGWVPGNFGEFYPEGFAKKLPANADIVLNMHYSPSPVPATDHSSVSIWLANQPPERLVKPFILDEQWVVNQPFYILPDTLITFYLRSPPIPIDISLLSIMPHMHLLGKSIEAFALIPDGRVVPLIRIPHWNFKWQMTYQFEHLVVLPKGSVILAEAVFDNTSANPLNPHNPPKPATYGWGTFNEMLNLIMEYVEYKKGDEELSLFNENR